MAPLTMIYLLHTFPNSNYWKIRLFGGPFSFELDKFDCTLKHIGTDMSETWGAQYMRKASGSRGEVEDGTLYEESKWF